MTARGYGKVAVLYGGLSSEREVSLKSGAAVLSALREAGVDAHGIDVDRQLPEKLAAGAYDRVFIALHGKFGEDGIIQGLLEWHGLPYTGSGILASALGMDKLRCKSVLKAAGLPVAEHVVLRSERDFVAAEARLGLPAVVKPSRQGSSIGIGKVYRSADWKTRWDEAIRHDSVVFAEAFIDGPEVTVGVLGNDALPVIRLETPREFYDYEAKYLLDSTRYHCPSGLDPRVEHRIVECAMQAFAAVGAHGWGRVDLMLDREGNPYVLEINTIPGMTDHSLVPMAARVAGITFPQLCLRILDSTEVTR
ncbi:MAG: D-alanine--D-alanine ligase [Acidiferrobacteraceae bacterium]